LHIYYALPGNRKTHFVEVAAAGVYDAAALGRIEISEPVPVPAGRLILFVAEKFSSSIWKITLRDFPYRNNTSRAGY
jgi:hypothetical protein